MDQIFSSTIVERRIYERLMAGMPAWSPDTSIGLGPHSLFAVDAILKLVRPRNILEIGFDRGRSSAMWLGLSEASVLSVDVSDDPELYAAVESLQQRYPNRLTFIRSDSQCVDLGSKEFDLAFIDGDHSYDGVLHDLCLARSLRVPWVALDDWMPEFGPGVQRAAADAGFDPLAVLKHNIALGRFRSE